MSGETTRRRAVTAVVLAVLLGAAGTASAPASHPEPRVRDLDLVASANPSAADPVVADDAFADNSTSFRRTVSSVVTATGSATCDGCDATSTALQVLYVRSSRQADLDNTAVAWTQQCTDCIATALSVQVVVLRGVPSIVPNNRALAVNAACTSCQASGVAFQLVVSSRQAGRLSRDALDDLRTWVAEQAALLRIPDPATVSPEPTPTPTARLARTKADRRAKRAAASALGTLEELVTDDLGAETVSADVELDR